MWSSGWEPGARAAGRRAPSSSVQVLAAMGAGELTGPQLPRIILELGCPRSHGTCPSGIGQGRGDALTAGGLLSPSLGFS